MNYIAHCDGEREQSILEHLQGTAEKAKDFAEVFEKGDWGYCCGMLHDIGKYSDKFQRRIRGEEIKVDHATAGARVCMELGGMYPFLEMCIAGHHAGLSDYGVSTDTGNSSTTLGRRKKKIEDFYAYKKEVKIPELKTSPVNVEKTKDLNFSLSMFTRMMYSCLVDADFLDTEEFMTEERSGRQQGQEIQVLLDKLEKYITEWLKNTETESVNGRRTEILKACLENGEREKGLFRLTVPTGGGKTVASLAFALRHAVKNHCCQYHHKPDQQRSCCIYHSFDVHLHHDPTSSLYCSFSIIILSSCCFLIFSSFMIKRWIVCALLRICLCNLICRSTCCRF